jgi:hypothetical protein
MRVAGAVAEADGRLKARGLLRALATATASMQQVHVLVFSDSGWYSVCVGDR